MTEWEPATEAEAAMRDALRANDQERYFRILARTELLLPVSAHALAGHAPMGWGTWTTSGRTHVLAFTSVNAMRACLGDSAGPTRRTGYHELAGNWPNLEWWLAVNPGLPVEGYLPAWFVSQLARGDVRLPGRTIGARARLERAESAARARATAIVPGRPQPHEPAPDHSAPQPPLPVRPAAPIENVAGANGGYPGAAPRPDASHPPAAGGYTPAAPVGGYTATAPPSRQSPAAPPTRPGVGTSGHDHGTSGDGSGSDGPTNFFTAIPRSARATPTAAVTQELSGWYAAAAKQAERTAAPESGASWLAGTVANPAAVVDADPTKPGHTPGPPAGSALGPDLTVAMPSPGPVAEADLTQAMPAPAPADPPVPVPHSPVEPPSGRYGTTDSAFAELAPVDPAFADYAPAEPAFAPTDPAHAPAEPAFAPADSAFAPAESAYAPAESAFVPVQPEHGPTAPAYPEVAPAEPAPGAAARALPPDFVPANDVEESLLAAAGDGSTDTFLSTLLLARVLLPVSASATPGSRPGDEGFVWNTERMDGETYVVVFTSAERLADHLTTSTETVSVKFVQVIRKWPDLEWSFAVNPGTPVGAKLPGSQIIALANWAAEVGLGDDTGTIEPVSSPVEETPRSTYAPAQEDPGRPTMMQKTIAPSQIIYYLERGYDRVSGFVHRAPEVAHLNTPAKLHAALGLGYANSPFARDADEIYVLRWPAYRPSLYRIPYGGQNEAAMRAMEGWVIERPPFRGNGFAPGESSDVVAEFKVDSARLPHGAELWRIGSDGTETLIATFDADVPNWQRLDTP